ncbi:hypothetical protein CK203_036429 [Vitis vinifera]|uniref:Uncharacterized protein n=1 Tax=Vitis vinifera TaxID=29760 RepID=A0A438HYV3_VITVI|nr:hypothetical protein CK203_036429 [Vitis vinifera]
MLNIDGMPLITDNHGGKGRSRVETGLQRFGSFQQFRGQTQGFEEEILKLLKKMKWRREVKTRELGKREEIFGFSEVWWGGFLKWGSVNARGVARGVLVFWDIKGCISLVLGKVERVFRLSWRLSKGCEVLEDIGARKLEGVFSEEEVFGALSELNGDKALRSDSFFMAFWQFSWEFVRDEVLNFFNEFHEHGRLKKVVDKVVSKLQNASVEGRQILDAMFIANGAVDSMLKKRL